MANQAKKQPVVLVTGASSGMGKEFARALLQEGYVVYAAARRIENMSDLAQSGALTLKMDITQEAEVQSAVQTILKNHGGVDVLINNAGFGLYGAMEDIPLQDARYQFEVNLFGMARLTQLLLPSMRAKQAGKIINLSSMGGKVYFPMGSWYHATKHAVEGWSDCLRIELAPFNIDVVIIEPGVIATEFGDVVMKPLVQRSGKGVYATMANAFANAMTESYKNDGASPPDVIVKLVLEAITATRPKTRYVAGKFAKPMMFIRKWFGDRTYDKAVLSMLK
jgi:NAD(P)-dependent dehydrogenase (short-subunit alcohol dehydrogenase family)